jgi:hypothetical protein
MRKPCRPRHRYRGTLHADGCPGPRRGIDPAESWFHWHVVCRRCRFEWMQVMFFDVRAYEVVA